MKNDITPEPPPAPPRGPAQPTTTGLGQQDPSRLMGIASIASAILSIVVGCIPYCRSWAIMLALVGIVLGIVTTVRRTRRREKLRMEISGIVLSSLAFIFVSSRSIAISETDVPPVLPETLAAVNDGKTNAADEAQEKTAATPTVPASSYETETPRLSARERALCEEAIGLMGRACRPFASGRELTVDDCSVHTGSQTGRPVDDLGEGAFVRYSDGLVFRLEWFAPDDGAWLTTNGQTATACPNLDGIEEKQRAIREEAAPARGTDAKTYEGLYDAEGNFKFADCSAFELQVANTVYREIYKNPNEPESRAMRRVRKKTGLSEEEATGIYGKAMSKCGWIAPGLN